MNIQRFLLKHGRKNLNRNNFLKVIGDLSEFVKKSFKLSLKKKDLAPDKDPGKNTKDQTPVMRKKQRFAARIRNIEFSYLLTLPAPKYAF